MESKIINNFSFNVISVTSLAFDTLDGYKPAVVFSDIDAVLAPMLITAAREHDNGLSGCKRAAFFSNGRNVYNKHDMLNGD